MCVIVHKERGKDLPSSEVIEKCFRRNPDGSGILLHRKGTKTIEIHKGFMKVDDFKEALKDLNVCKDDDLVMHFRITTSGGTSKENCHPFPISSSVDDLKALRINVSKAFVHNGVLGKGDEKLKISDTQCFVRDVMSRDEVSNHLENEEVQKVIEKMAESQRFFVADAEKDVFKRFGTWYEDGGLWFSNLSWRAYSNSWYGESLCSGYSSKYYGSTYSTNDAWKNTLPYSGKSYSKVPDINTILCPYCDKEMELMMEGTNAYLCPECGTVYNDEDFEIYDTINGKWISIIDINDFDEDAAL